MPTTTVRTASSRLDPFPNTHLPELLDDAQAVTVSTDGKHVYLAVLSPYTKGNLSGWLVTDIEIF